MCVENRMTKRQRDAYLAKKPDIITTWKLITFDGYSDFHVPGSPKLTESRILKARHEQGSKSYIDYAPGFHSFFTKKGAWNWGSGVVRKFYIRKSWVTQIGTSVGRNYKVYVSKKITCDRKLLED